MVLPRELSSPWLQSNIGKSEEADALWELFDSVEKGLATGGVLAELQRPCSQSDKLQQFFVVRSADCRGYQLFSSGGDALMNAVFRVTEPKVELFLYNFDQKTYDDSHPVFSLSCGSDRTTWILVQEQHGSCPSFPSSPASPSTPVLLDTSNTQPQQLAFIRHLCEDVGHGLARCMEVSLPTHQECPGRRRSEPDLRSGRGLAHHLVTRLPDWDAAKQSLTLDFEGRRPQGSAKNFQLVLENSPREPVLQYGKIGANAFCLDFKAPLSIVQAFGAALSAAYWT